jgi:hypothetical protein
MWLSLERIRNMDFDNLRPAIVRYAGVKNEKFTPGNEYEAFFVEYWQGQRNSLHVRGNDGKITDYNSFEDFVVLSDEDNLLNDYEATVRCITDKYDDISLVSGSVYKAIGCDKDGLYLVMDESFDCYFYPSEDFEIVCDEHGILKRQSIYYSYMP